MSKFDGHMSAEHSHHALPEPVAAVIEAIETDIIKGRILPRTRLIEDHLMDDYDAKRHVVRAALVELERLGVVVKPPHLGAQIRRFDAQALDDLYRMRSVLHRAAVTMMKLPVDPERLDRVTAAMQAHADAAESGDIIQINRANMQFHRELYGLCDNPYLAESIRLHDWLSFPARAYGVADTEALAQACQEHADMVDALRTCDRERLDRLSYGHMDRARAIYAAKFLSK
ncbi:GntR family transcriptional regulator [Pseudomonas sp. SLFW]|uniref:GntR family transcriptional regulator n=1 Tax=Pseudomonas sp. SLFW TaxID=2683259 RepID=UPI0014125284|nr:GntR family transcriptional regulator [Pseudomonas sp. SLFW]NBB10272.1 FCD domain-containing protein [Pseudomonas sp. SLFW]